MSEAPPERSPSGEAPPEPPSLPEQLAAHFREPVTGLAYRRPVRLFTLGAVIFIVGYAARVFGTRPDVGTPILVLLAAAGAIVLVNAWYIVTGRTTVDHRGVRQQWMFPKDHPWTEIARARRVKLPFTVRLLVVTGRGPVRAIHAGDPALDRAFDDITRLYAGKPHAR